MRNDTTEERVKKITRVSEIFESVVLNQIMARKTDAKVVSEKGLLVWIKLAPYRS